MDEGLLRRLLATPPDVFTAARNAAAKELRKDKQRDAATAVAALRRPSWTDWALNVVADGHADVVAEFGDAASTSREAQAAAIEDRDGPDVRASLRDLRAAIADLARPAGAVLEQRGRPAATADLTARLVEVAGNAEASDDLLAGVLGAGGVGSTEMFAGLEPATRPERSSRSPKSPTKRTPSKSEGDDQASRNAERAAAADRKRAAHQLERAEREHRGAMRDLARVDADVERATAEVDDARATLEAARNQLDVAERRLDGAQRQRAKVADSVERSKSALDEARADVARAGATG